MLANIASVFILGLGVIAALNQVGIATTVTTPVLVAVLATVGGIIVVGVGGGLIKPMQHRWEGYLNKAEAESGNIRQEVAASPGVKEQARQTKEKHGDSSSADDYSTSGGARTAPADAEPVDLTQPYDQTQGTRPTH